MLRVVRSVRVSFIFAVCVWGLPISFAVAQWGVGSGERPDSEFRREPFKLKLSGFLNTKPDEHSLAVVTLGIHTYRENYQFEVVHAEAVDDPRISPRALLQQVGKYQVDFNLIGPHKLFSKIAQSPPGTPLAIVGYFQQRNRNLQLLSVEVIGMTN